MSNYFIDCCKDHAEGMKKRELSLENKITVLRAELDILTEERRNLECGIDNWIQESADDS